MFSLSEKQRDAVREWSKEQDAVVAEQQRAAQKADPEIAEAPFLPYYGAVGGAVTYEFTPTSIGTVVKVRHGVTKAVLDVSDYDSW